MAAPASAHANVSRALPLMERPALAALLALVAGLLNAWTLAEAGSFATVQSGNIVSAGYYLVGGDWNALGRVCLSIFAFAAGAFACGVAVAFADRRRASYTPWILCVESALLVFASLLFVPGGVDVMLVAAVLSFVAGMQGNAFHRDSGMLYGNVAVTFVLQAASASLARATMRPVFDDGERHIRPAAVYGLVLVGFAAGGAAGFLLNLWVPVGSIAAAAAGTAALAFAVAGRRVNVDPSQNVPSP